MKTVSRWRSAVVLLSAVAALVGSDASGQSRDAGIAATGTTTMATVDGGTSMVSSGASADTSDAGEPIAEFGREPPPAAVAPRPDPTPEQLAGLAMLEQEVQGFTERGDAYRRSINGLLQREHDNQLDRLRHGFDRQISAERDAEAEARRHAIQVFERFLELYPDDPEHTPDVMFRLAELYYDEAAYAKLEADEQVDRMRETREAAGQPTDDLVAPPVDYRCSILLYRNVVGRFPSFRLRDATHYLLGWVLKEMGKEDEAIGSYRGLVCPAHFQYQGQFDLAASLVPNQETPVACGHLFDLLRPAGAQYITPPTVAVPGAADADGGAATGEGGAPITAATESGINASLVSPGNPTDTDPMPIPQDYAACAPLNGANGEPSRYAGEVWYYIGDYHFDNPPSSNADLGNAYAVAAYMASMRASETHRPGLAAANAARAGNTPAAGLRGAGTNLTTDDNGVSNTGAGVTAANSPGRAQFNGDTEYGVFWSKSLYKIGWSYFRMLNGYPQALQTFARLLDYYDWVGSEAAAAGNRTDTIKWVGVIFSESTWGASTSNDSVDCQRVVEQVAHPPREATRPFDCAGIIRITSPLSPLAMMAAHDAGSAQHVAPQPGHPTYIPQDRPWTPEAYLELANDYFQQTKYYEAITLYRIFLQLYPLHFQAPHVAENIAISYERQRQFDLAIAARGGLALYTEGGAWWNANNSHPDAQRYAELIARNSLHDNAIQHHQRASAARGRSSSFRRCSLGQPAGDVCQPGRTARERADLEAQALASLQTANSEYNLAVLAYNEFIHAYPNDESAYEFRYNRADAMYWAGRYADAGHAYAEVRESNENDQFLAAAAFMSVKSLEAQIRTAAQARQIDPCIAVRAGILPADLLDPRTGAPMLDAAAVTACQNVPTATGAPATPSAGTATSAQAITQLNIPDPVRALMDARIAYTNRVPRALDSVRGLQGVFTSEPGHPENDPPFRAKFAYINARTLLWFGHAQEAETQLRAVLRAFCDDAVVGRATFADLHNLLVVQGRENDLETLAHQQQGSRCAPSDILVVDITNAQFRHALETFHQAEQASGQQSLNLYEQAANQMRAAVAANRNHPQAPLATFYTALAYERTNRFDTATQTYIRITQDYNTLTEVGSNPPRDLTGDDLHQRINTLEVSNFRAGVNLERTFDYDNAIRYFNTVVSDPRFATAQDHATHVHDALEDIALDNTNLGRWVAAREAWRAFLPHTNDAHEHAVAQYRIAEMPFRAQDWAGAERSLRDYRAHTPMNADTAEFHVQAQYNIAQALHSRGDQAGYRRELRAVATVFQQSGQAHASAAAHYAAEALFVDLDQQITTFMARTLTAGTADQLAAQVRTLKTELDQLDTAAQGVFDLGGGEYSLAAIERRGEAHEYLATQEVRIAALVQHSHAEIAAVARATAAADRLEVLAGRVEGSNATLANRLRNQEQTIRDSIQQQQDAQSSGVQTRFDAESAAERKLAIQDYALVVFLARRDNIPTTFAGRALEHIQTEENRPLIDDAIHAMNPRVVQASHFVYTQGMFDTQAPGADLTQTNPVATPGLAGE